MGSYFDSEKFQNGLKKVGKGAPFYYRSRFDPLSEEEYRYLLKMEKGKDSE